MIQVRWCSIGLDALMLMLVCKYSVVLLVIAVDNTAVNLCGKGIWTTA